jgi:acetyl esterase/lipase
MRLFARPLRPITRHKRQNQRTPQAESLEARALLSALSAATPRRLKAAEIAGFKADSKPLGVRQRISGLTYSRDGSKLDVYSPVGTPPEGGWRAIVAMPGGGWRWASRSSYGGALAGLAKQGYVVVAIDYAYASPGGRSTWPANIEDVRSAVRWVRKNAGRLSVNAEKIVAMGESAGGHLAALAGVLPDGPVPREGADTQTSRSVPRQISARVAAVVDFYGPTDLVKEWDQQPEGRPYLASFLGGPPSRLRERYVAASPISHVSSDDPPMYIVQGTADKIVDTSQSIELANALRDAGVPVTLKLLQGVPHGFRFKLKSANMQGLLAFLDEVLGS